MYSKKPVVAELDGGQTDNNSYLFKGGYDSILNPLYKNGTFKKGPDQFTPDWDNQKAQTIFEQMLVKTSNKIDAVAAANDGLANAVVVALKATGPEADPAVRSGCDGAGRPEHHLRLADDDGLEGHARAGGQVGRVAADRARSRARSRSRTSDGDTKRRAARDAGVHHPAGGDHEGELQAALQRLPEEERRLQRRVREVLRQACVGRAHRAEGARCAGGPGSLLLGPVMHR